MVLRRWVILAGMMCLPPVGGLAAEGTEKARAPGFYRPRATWWETMIASREALGEQEAAAERQAEADRRADPMLRAFQPLRTWVSSGQEPRRIKLRVAWVKHLYLGCAGRAEVFLGDPQVIDRDAQPTALPLARARLTGGRGWANVKAGDWGTRKYSAGVLLWDKEICVELDGRAEWLEGWVGARDSREVRHGQFWVHCRPMADIAASRPGDYFSTGGTLGKMLLAGHPDKDGKKRVELDRESFQRIVDWMDVNAQFYGDYSWNRIEWQPPSPAGEKPCHYPHLFSQPGWGYRR